MTEEKNEILVDFHKKVTLLQTIKQKLERENSDFEWNIKENKERILITDSILKIFEKYYCSNCKGLGQVTVCYDQDYVKTEICSKCKGLGYIQK